MLRGLNYRLTVDGDEIGQVILFAVNESVAGLYQVNLLVGCSVSVDSLVNEKACFELLYPDKTGKQLLSRVFHGAVFQCNTLDCADAGYASLYQITIKPRLAKAAYLSGNETYINLTPAGVIAEILDELGLEEGTDYDLSHLKQGETGAVPRYSKHACKLKYQETHLDFLHRILEQEGIYYRFVQEETHEKLCFYDDKSQHLPPSAVFVDFNPKAALDVEYRFNLVHGLKKSHSVTPLKMRVQGQHQDFSNSMPITAVYQIDPPVHQMQIPVLHRGIYRHDVCFYDAEQEVALAKARAQLKQDERKLATLQLERVRVHKVNRQVMERTSQAIHSGREDVMKAEQQLYQSLTAQAERFARIALEAEACRAVSFAGRSTCINMSSGYEYTLRGHPVSDCNVSLYITEMQHVGVNPDYVSRLRDVMHISWEVIQKDMHIPLVVTDFNQMPAYVNYFTAIPAEQQFRMSQKTPVPAVDGLLVGFIDADVDSQSKKQVSGVLDEQGRYRVRFSFDRMNQNKKFASAWLPMMQPFSGSHGDGMHFPLLSGTRVSIACINGHPDRCVIAHALPDANHPPLVTDLNIYEKKIVTAGQNRLLFDDQPGEESIVLASPQGNSQLTMGYIRRKPGVLAADMVDDDMNGVSISTEGKQVRVSTGGSELVHFDPDSVINIQEKSYSANNVDEFIADLKRRARSSDASEKTQDQQDQDIEQYDHVNVQVGSQYSNIKGSVKSVRLPAEGKKHYVQINQGYPSVHYRAVIRKASSSDDENQSGSAHKNHLG